MEFMFKAFLVFTILPWHLDAFNIDTSKAQIFSAPSGYKGSYFGYSVALHSYTSQNWLLVGAPLSNVSDGSSVSSLNLKNYGGIFKCKVPSSSPTCTYIPIDNKANEKKDGLLNNEQATLVIETKENQWLGAVLDSTGKNGKVVYLECLRPQISNTFTPAFLNQQTCAPRYAFRGMPPRASSTFQYKWLIGRCFEVETSLNGAKPSINPCLEKKKGNNYYGYCQTGLSAKITADKSHDIAMGAVGVSRWKGGIITYSPSFTRTTFSTQDQINHGNYMGYSVTSGFFALSNKTGIAGGAPRAENIKGKVLIYQMEDQQLTVSAALPQPKNIKMGSYFGSVLCSVDLNRDGYTDMLVGAPLYSDVGDEGRVFVYMNNKKGALNLMSNMDLTGDKVAEGRFGSSIAGVGDLNNDGFEDVVIGAPYEGSGAVYIYHGTNNGIDPKYKQKIKASDVQASLSQFGQSIAGGLDVDGNGYPDIAVGAFGSDQAVLFRTQKVINVEAEVQLNVQRIVLENNETTCRESDGLHKCLNVTVCFRNLETHPTDLNISYKVELDRDKGSDALKRMYFYNNSKRSFVVSRQQLMPFQRKEKVCLPPYTVHLRNEDRIIDLLSVLTFDLSFDLSDTSCGNALCPVLNSYKPKQTRAVATFQKQCGGDICTPDLSVTGKTLIPGNLTEVRVGTVQEMTLVVDIKNKASDSAYLAQVLISYPTTFDYIGPRASDQVQCMTSVTSNATETATCTVGNPFKGNSNKTFGIKFGTTELVNDFYITITAKSVNKDLDTKDNEVKIKVRVKFEADLEVVGSSVPDKVIYEGKAKEISKVKTQSDIGPKIAQTIIVQNKGPSKVDGSEISISVPSIYQGKKEDYLIYMLQVELTGASGSCNTKGALNPLEIPVGNITNEPKESRRKRRDITTIHSCRHTTCKVFKCRLGLLLPGEKAEITIRSRLWQSTLIRRNAGSVGIETLASVSIPDNRYTQPDKENDVAKIIITASPVSSGQAVQRTPWWVYFLAALGGVLLLAIAVGIMYKLGFFKRKRVKDISNPQTDGPLVS